MRYSILALGLAVVPLAAQAEDARSYYLAHKREVQRSCSHATEREARDKGLKAFHWTSSVLRRRARWSGMESNGSVLTLNGDAAEAQHRKIIYHCSLTIDPPEVRVNKVWFGKIAPRD